MVSYASRPRGADSRSRLLAAAAAEFAARGFSATTVDRIAARARLNKAMVYYHFHDKTALYRAILVDVFRRVADAVTAAPRGGRAADQLRVFIRTVASEAIARPHFPAMWLREVADGGAHLGPDVAVEIARVVRVLGEILEQGVVERDFERAHPLIVQMNIVAPLLMFAATAGARVKLAKALPDAAAVDRDDFMRFVETATLSALRRTAAAEPAAAAKPAAPSRRRPS